MTHENEKSPKKRQRLPPSIRRGSKRSSRDCVIKDERRNRELMRWDPHWWCWRQRRRRPMMIFIISKEFWESSHDRGGERSRSSGKRTRCPRSLCDDDCFMAFYDDDDKLLSRQKRISIRTSNLPELRSFFLLSTRCVFIRDSTETPNHNLDFCFYFIIQSSLNFHVHFHSMLECFSLRLFSRLINVECHFQTVTLLLCCVPLLFYIQLSFFYSFPLNSGQWAPLSPPVAVIVDFVFFLPRAPELLIAKSNFRQSSRRSFWKWNEITWKCHDNYI